MLRLSWFFKEVEGCGRSLVRLGPGDGSGSSGDYGRSPYADSGPEALLEAFASVHREDYLRPGRGDFET